MEVTKIKGEEWDRVRVQGYTEYSVSNLGRVYSHKANKLLKPFDNGKGYLRVELNYMGRSSNYYVHRLVALSFVENPNNYPIVNHKDSNPKNNTHNNLEWCTNDMNLSHAFENNRYKKLQGSDVITSKLNEKEVIEIRALFKEGFTRRQLAEKYHTKPSNIKDIVLRRSWKHL